MAAKSNRRDRSSVTTTRAGGWLPKKKKKRIEKEVEGEIARLSSILFDKGEHRRALACPDRQRLTLSLFLSEGIA